MRRNGYSGASGQNWTPTFDPATSISYKAGIFSLSDDLRHIFDAFVLNFCDLVTLTFDFLTLTVSHTMLHTSNLYINFHHSKIIRSWVMDDSFPIRCTVIAHARDSSPGRAKMIHVFEIPQPSLYIHLITFRALQRRLSHVIL